jgi:hypothetical protein
MLQPLPPGTIPYAAVAARHGSMRDNVRDARTARSGSSEIEPLPEDHPFPHPVECLLPVCTAQGRLCNRRGGRVFLRTKSSSLAFVIPTIANLSTRFCLP